MNWVKNLRNTRPTGDKPRSLQLKSTKFHAAKDGRVRFKPAPDVSAIPRTALQKKTEIKSERVLATYQIVVGGIYLTESV